MSSPKATPNEKYSSEASRVYLSGNQALVRMTIDQARHDRAAGLHTAGFVSGYRGSPLGHLPSKRAKRVPFAPAVCHGIASTVQPARSSRWGDMAVAISARQANPLNIRKLLLPANIEAQRHTFPDVICIQ